ncbi:MAG: methyltransferase domain-containing protein [Bacteroidales bacterium]|nr:methyltransferase domain-containing protein [Bacteroidales bacterium]
MNADEFTELFIEELRSNPELTDYYRIVNKDSLLPFRKAYFHQRLQYVYDQVKTPESSIWDVGCGYATTSIFLALNGHKLTGSTLEYYYGKIEKRLEYWSKFGSLDTLTIKYENLFDTSYPKKNFDVILAQDTLHHLEPIVEALEIMGNSLAKEGKMIVSEENGNNIINNLKNFKRRGFKRITAYYDDQLQKTILFGNENTRSLKAWQKLLENKNFSIDHYEYIRLYPPFYYHNIDYNTVIDSEQKIWRKNKLLRELLFFGINFTASKFHD